MKLRRVTVTVLVGMIAISLIGLLALQYILIKNAYELKQQAFRQNVSAAMNNIVQKLETGEAVGNTFRILVKEPHSQLDVHMMKAHKDSLSVSIAEDTLGPVKKKFGDKSLTDSEELHITNPPLRWKEGKIWYTVLTPQHILIRALNQTTGKDTVIVNAFEPAGEHSVGIDDNAIKNGNLIVKFLSDDLTYTMEVRNAKSNEAYSDRASFERREELVGRVVDKLFLGEQKPIGKRLNPGTLDSVINASLKEAGINQSYAYGVISEQNDSFPIIQPTAYIHELQGSEFKARLFPNDIFQSFNQLALFFPEQQIFLLKQIGPLLAPTILFMGIIIYCFAFTVKTIIRQKQFSARLVDFINNMTHEFKTPISTIAVAVDTMMHPDVISNNEKLTRYGLVIQDENQRMKHQVDKILQMALLEQGTYTLKRVPIEVHETIAKAVENISLQAKSKNGSVTFHPEAGNHVIEADAVHFANIIHNVLDNANKYSPSSPVITITTSNVAGNILITVTDNGVGISEEDQQRVFEKYFRVSTGNVHDVKGFGLGLSYVRLMAEAHGGSVQLKSAKGRGTTIILSFPILDSIQ